MTNELVGTGGLIIESELNTFKLVDGEVIQLNTMLATIRTVMPDTITLETLYYSLRDNAINLVIETPNDHDLLKFEQQLLESNLIKTVEFTTAGPDTHSIDIRFREVLKNAE